MKWYSYSKHGVRVRVPLTLRTSTKNHVIYGAGVGIPVLRHIETWARGSRSAKPGQSGLETISWKNVKLMGR